MSTGRLGAGDTAIQPTIFDAKGDLLTATAGDTPARIAVGNNGETLVADSSASTGLIWQGNFAAGKNKIINGDFTINQRAFSSITTTGTYGFDRWLSSFAGDGTSTMSAQTFTAGAAPVAGYEATNFVRLESTGQTSSATRTVVQQRIEDVRTFANQTVTVSFWAKASSGTPSVAANFLQNFGSGGSSLVNVNGQKIAITTSWARYSFTFNIPSISGKTLGASSFLMLRIWTSCGSDEATDSNSLGIQTATIDIWGVQVEAGNVATAFQTATGTLAGELAACQRYFNRFSSEGNAYNIFSVGLVRQTGAGANSYFPFNFPVEMRIAPTAVTLTNITSCRIQQGATDSTVTAGAFDGGTKKTGIITAQATIAATGIGCLSANNSTAVTIDWSAEL